MEYIEPLYYKQTNDQKDVTVVITTTQWGTWEGQPACLLLLNFRFFYPRDARYQEAFVSVNVRRPEGRPPALAVYGPKMMEGKSTEVNTTWNYNAELTAQFSGAGSFEVGPSGSVGKETEYIREYTGMVKSEERCTKDQNSVRWILYENKMQKEGVPPSLRAAIIVKCDGEFLVDAKAKTTPDWPDFICKPEKNVATIPFEGGKEDELEEFSTWTQEQWGEKLVPALMNKSHNSL